MVAQKKNKHVCNLFRWLTAVFIWRIVFASYLAGKHSKRGDGKLSLCPAEGSIASWETSLICTNVFVSPCRPSPTHPPTQVKRGLFLGRGPEWRQLKKGQQSSGLCVGQCFTLKGSDAGRDRVQPGGQQYLLVAEGLRALDFALPVVLHDHHGRVDFSHRQVCRCWENDKLTCKD